ncbi:uncharacterized protein BX663DRAFT_508818 [Cokeromyces recurvatus]|uniref:uncharacterized protein n=1 Tax=Cokeromyces recurvatus TaxID=90255 RepID=UPI00221F2168|nr:uncharacterized protein BX663DRAFT_508818 [Cokeromyces recurvatus]KAI7902908.1 hypothetical protein BX663DRAFT_508818 [Cokeromyces recurvatus]
MPTDKFIADSDEEVDKEYKPSKKQETDDSEEEFVEENTEKGKSPDNKKRLREEEVEIIRDEDGNPILPLTNKRRVIVRQFPSGDAAIDIREVYQDKNTGKMRPGKGICLPMAQWTKLKELLPEIDRIIESLPSKKQK